jgi:Mg2+-importing ATPase
MAAVHEIGGKPALFIKGAYEVLKKLDPEADGARWEAELEAMAEKGLRVLAFGQGEAGPEPWRVRIVGLIGFADPAKAGVKDAVATAKKAGLRVIMITGDHAATARSIARDAGIWQEGDGVLSGDDLDGMDDAALNAALKKTTVLARILPEQKYRVVKVLQEHREIVAVTGDGVNDVPALKAADVGLSVENAVDVAREAADIILLRKNLNVLAAGIDEGRRTFANIVKYVRMGASSNFGNMISMTGASLVLPFLPMLPIQILLNNFLYDISQVALPTDTVDPEALEHPRPWDVSSIRRFMFLFGPLSSLFDFATFGVLWLLFGRQPSFFQTGWFLESFLSQSLVVYVIRTRKRPWAGARPSLPLLASTVLLGIVVLWLPTSILAKPFGFASLPPLYFTALALILGTYLALAQTLKTYFIRRYGYN